MSIGSLVWAGLGFGGLAEFGTGSFLGCNVGWVEVLVGLGAFGAWYSCSSGLVGG